MNGDISRWINRITERKRRKEEIPYILGEYFESGLNYDEDVAQGLNMKTEEIRMLRNEYES